MKISETPEDLKMYELVLNNGSKYIVNGRTRINILKSNSNFVELENGSTINKVYIIEFKLDIDETKLQVQKNKKQLPTGVTIL